MGATSIPRAGLRGEALNPHPFPLRGSEWTAAHCIVCGVGKGARATERRPPLWCVGRGHTLVTERRIATDLASPRWLDGGAAGEGVQVDRTVYVGNFPSSVQEDALKVLFANCGTVVSTRIAG